MKKSLKLVCFMLAGILLFTGCYHKVQSKKPNSFSSKPEDDLSDAEIIAGMTKEIIENMTLDEKIGQLFIVNTELLEGKVKKHEFLKLNKKMKETLGRYPVGGIVFFSRNIKTREQTKKFISDLQSAVKIPLFTAVDEEGGEVSRIASNDKMETTKFPTMEQIGMAADENYVYNMGETIGREIKELGFNVDFAPVADVKTNKLNTEIGSRSFGSDAKKVSKFVKKMVEGLQAGGVCSTLKHFPGHGNASSDTHAGAVDVDNDISRLRKVDFLPFKAGIEAGADFIMTSHISISKVTEDTLPASLSKIVLTDMIRTELGFEGIIISDAMNMGAVTEHYTTKETVVTAIENGTDIVLMPESLEDAYSAMYEAIAEERITKEQLDESLGRIISTKIKKGIISKDSSLLKEILGPQKEAE